MKESNHSPVLGMDTNQFNSVANATFLGVLNSFDSAVIVLDGRGLILYASANIQGITGFDSASLIGQRLGQSGLPREFRFILRSRERDLITNGGETSFEIAIPTVKKNHWLHWTLKALDTAVGRVIMCYGRDMEGERNTREVEHLLFTSLVDGYAVHEMLYNEQGQAVDYRFIMVNPAFERLTGLSADEVIGNTVKQVMPQTEQSWIDTYAQVIAEHTPVYFSNYSKAVDRFYDVQAFPMEDQRFAVVFRDVTVTRKAEEEIRRERDKSNRIMDLSPAGTLILDNRGVISFANIRAAEFLGIDVSNLIGRRYEDPRLHIYSECGWPVSDTDSIVRQIIQTGQAIYGECVRVREHDYRFLIINGAPLLGRSGQVESIVLTMEDISERKMQEASLERNLREKKVLIHEMNHRVKNNLAVILGMVRMHRGTGNQVSDDVIKAMESRIFAIGLLHSLLFDSEGIRKVMPEEYLQRLLEQISQGYSSKEIAIICNVSGSIQSAGLSTEKLNALGLITNELVTNALKYAFGSKHSNQKVLVTLHSSSNGIELLVEDNGCGFPESKLQEFKITPKGGQGMNLVMNLCNSLGGQIEVSNRQSGGASTRLLLPMGEP